MVSAVECVHADSCPGCALIQRPYAEQLVIKRERVERAFGRYPLLAEVRVAETRAADPISGYRTRAKLAVAAGGRIGAYAAGSHRVIDIPECRVVSAPIARTLAALRKLLADRGIDSVTAVDARTAATPDGPRVLVTLVVDRERPLAEDVASALGAELMQASSDVAGVALSSGAARGPQLLGAAPRSVAGRAELVDRSEGVELIAAPGAFVQVHRGQAEAIVRRIAARFEAVPGGLEGARVLDLYGGSGAIGIPLSARGARVTIVESYPAAAAAARRAGQPFADRVRVISDDAARFMVGEKHSFDAIVVNPPRRGVAPEVRAAIAELTPRVAAYVSCNPETLARDLAHFALLGMGVESAEPIDMIPLTEEVETLVLLAPRPAPPPRVLFEDDELVVIDKPPHEPTIPQGEHTGSLLARVRALPGCPNAAPVHRLDLGTSGVCVFAKTAAAAAKWSNAWSGARKHYIALARGITSRRGVVNRPLADDRRQRAARTRYERLEVVSGHSLVDVVPEQGRKHQIRRHLAGLGHPIVGDARYGHLPTNRYFAERYGLDRPFLHCARIEIAIATDGGPHHAFEAPLAPDLAAVRHAVSSPAESGPAR